MSAPVSPAVRRLRMKQVRRLLLILAVLIVALVVVALLPQGQHRGGLAVPTSSEGGDAKATGVVQGVLRGARSGDRVCFTVDALQGHVLLVLPPGWSADAQLRLLDPGGVPRARTGAAATFVGRPGAVGTVAGCADSGRLWYTTDVRRPAGTAPSS